MKSIFELENRLDISTEFNKLLEIFEGDKEAVIYENKYGNKVYGRFIDGINETVFLEWKYRDTFLDVFEYLEFIGINEIFLEEGNYNDQNRFLLYLEFIVNMAYLIKNNNKIKLLPKTNAAINNIAIILEKMNYKIDELDDKIVIIKRNSDVDSVLNTVPEDISKRLLEYNDFRISKNINEKRKILKSIDLYMDNENKYIKRNIDNELKNCIETIVNNMGINHNNEEEPFISMTIEEKLEWYDKCFLMMIHAIRSIEVNKIKKAD